MLRTVKKQMITTYRSGTTAMKMTSANCYNQTNQLVMNSFIGVLHIRNFSTDN